MKQLLHIAISDVLRCIEYEQRTGKYKQSVYEVLALAVWLDLTTKHLNNITQCNYTKG